VPSFLRRAAGRGDRWALVFCDPPYGLAGRAGDQLGLLLPPVLEKGARIVCESSHRQPLTLELPLVTERRYGDTLVAIYSC
jgi:16S rRNA G966 N2-methylase RsmD